MHDLEIDIYIYIEREREYNFHRQMNRYINWIRAQECVVYGICDDYHDKYGGSYSAIYHVYSWAYFQKAHE